MDHQQENVPVANEEDEVRWTDDCIRWTEEEIKNNKNDDDDDDDGAVDIFKADPYDIFSFRFVRPNDTDEESLAFIDIELRGYKADSDEIWQSTGLTLWKASEHLCHYMVKHYATLLQVDSPRILELGAGLGLVGIVAHHMAPDSTVCLTDGDTDALVHLRQNVERNTENTDFVSCHQLLWGHETAAKFLEKQTGKAFDVILASDILYAKCVVEPLWETVRMVLSRPNGVFVMAFATRKVAVTIDDFIKAADGFTYKCVDSKEGVFVYEFRWNSEE